VLSPVPEVCFVDHIGRGAELVGDVRERHVADAQPTLLVGMRRYRPDGWIEPRGAA